MGEILGKEPIVVGGIAEDLYTGQAYIATDLDLCGWVTAQEETVLASLDFKREGRHLSHVPSEVAVEFPESIVQGEEERFVRKPVGTGTAVIIGVDDFYLDRIRQTTMYAPGSEPIEFKAALAVAVASYDDIDWEYVDQEIKTTEEKDPSLGKAMREVHKRVRRRLLSELRKMGR